MREISVTEAARHFSELIGRVFYKGESALLLKGGKPMAKVIPVRRPKMGRELAKLWSKLPHLSHEDAIAFEHDLEEARKKIPAVRNPWG